MSELLLVAYCPTLQALDKRPVLLAKEIELTFPSEHLDFTLSTQGAPLRLSDRNEFLRNGTSQSEIPLLCNGSEGRLVSLSGYVIPASLAPGSTPLLDVAIQVPETSAFIEKSTDLVLNVCEVLQAFWAVMTPKAVAAEIGAQTSFPHLPSKPVRGLPPLSPPHVLNSPFVPQRLGWLNYWSKETADLIGFPEASRDAMLPASSYMSTTGSWVVKLTQDPLNLELPDHLAALKQAYDRFPAIGGRNS